MNQYLLLFLIPFLMGAAPSRLHTYTSGQPISSSDVTENENALFNYCQAGIEVIKDGVIVNADVSSTANIQSNKLNLSAITQDITTSGAITASSLTTCDTIDTNSDGLFSCGTDAGLALGSLIEYEELNLMTSSQLAGKIINETGTGSLVFQNSATMTSLTVGTALTITEGIITDGTITGADIKNDDVALTTDTSGNYVASVTNGAGITGGDGGGEGSALTLAVTLGTTIDYSEIVPTSSSQLAGIITNETGTGSLVFQNSAAMTALTVSTSIALPASAVDAITEIDSTLKSGSDTTLVTGTEGSTNEIAVWNIDGDLVDNNIIMGTMTDSKWCSYASSGTLLSCTQDAPSGSQNVWETFIGGNGGSTTANTATDILTVNGATGITVGISGDVVSIGRAAPYAIGSFNRDLTTASGSVAYTGIGFQGDALILNCALPPDQSASWGMAQSTTEWGIFDGDDGSTNYGGSTNKIFRIDVSAGNNNSAIIDSFDVDGFTLGYTKNGTPTGTVNCIYLVFR